MVGMLWAVLAGPLGAQSIEAGDNPDYGVARLSLLNGEVSVQRGDTGEVVAGELNAPLVALDHVLTGPGSRAEVQIDWAHMLRLGPSSEIRLGELRDQDYQVQVAEGTVTVRVLRDTRAALEIGTPTVSVRPSERGAYRITVRPDGYTEVTVRSGQAEIVTPRGVEILRSGRMLQARGTPADPEYMIVAAAPKDDWDRWNENRDRDLERSQSYRYVSRDIYGADDLDRWGRWVWDPPYGWVWVPNAAPNWAPYRLGRWIWINYYGWTWLSADPWGWAPYHYGAWYWGPYGWAWYPGVITRRYFWRPALVGFFGWGTAGVSVGVGWSWGHIGWVPLAPFEVYRPWYGPAFRNTTVVNNITVVNRTNIVNVYRNARQFNGRDAVTSIPAAQFGRTRIDTDNYVRVRPADLTRAGRLEGPLPLEPARESRRFSDRAPAPELAARAARGRPVQFATGLERGARRSGAALETPAVALPDAGPRERLEGGGGVTRTGVDRAVQPSPARELPAASTGGWRRFEGGATQGIRGAGLGTTEAVPRSQRGSEEGFAPPRESRRQATELTPRSPGELRRREPPGFGAGDARRALPEPVPSNPPMVGDRGPASLPGTRRSAPPATVWESSPPSWNPAGGSVRAAPRRESAPRDALSAPPVGGSMRQSAPLGGGLRGASPASAGPAGGEGGGGGRRR